MKKILFILPSLTVGGLERTQVTLANALQRAGYAVTVMMLDPQNELGKELDKGVRLIYKPYKQHLGNKIPFIRHRLYDDGMWETRATPRQLYSYYVGDEKFDVEIAYFHGLPVKIISGSANRSAVHLTWVHNDYTKIHGYRLNFKSDEAMRAAYRGMDKVVCVSKQAREGFIKSVGDFGNAITIYNLLPAAQIRRLARQAIEYQYPENTLKLVLTGRLKDSHKGQCRLIEVLARLKKEGRQISLTLVGDGSDREKIEAAVRRHHLEDRVFLTGSQRNPYPYIAQADLLVCASYYEGYNLTVAEALILGVPVMSTECAGPCEILDSGKYGMLVQNDEEGLYNGLKLLYDSPDLLKEYKDKAALRQDFFDEETIIKQITELF